jgi:hypothetical protein
VKYLRNSSSKSGLTVVDVTDCANIDVRFSPLCPPVFLVLVVVVVKSLLFGKLGYSPRTFAMISFATEAGTSAYESNVML